MWYGVMIRKAFIISGRTFLVLSAFSCVSLAALWMASRFTFVTAEVVNTEDILVVVAVADGHMAIHWDYFTHNVGLDLVELSTKTSHGFYLSSGSPWSISGPRYYSDQTHKLGLDLWLPILLTAAGPTWFLIRFVRGPIRRMRRRRPARRRP